MDLYGRRVDEKKISNIQGDSILDVQILGVVHPKTIIKVHINMGPQIHSFKLGPFS
jgi:hypothetical protein